MNFSIVVKSFIISASSKTRKKTTTTHQYTRIQSHEINFLYWMRSTLAKSKRKKTHTRTHQCTVHMPVSAELCECGQCVVHLIAYCRADSIKCTSTAALVSMFKFNLAPKNSCRDCCMCCCFFLLSILCLFSHRSVSVLALFFLRGARLYTCFCCFYWWYCCLHRWKHMEFSLLLSVSLCLTFCRTDDTKKLQCFSICSFPFLFDQTTPICCVSFSLSLFLSSSLIELCDCRLDRLSFCF